MASMLSNRWTKKDEVVTIEAYTYDNFYQFIRFLYIGNCDLTNENVFQLTDMSEFYAVPFLKEFCETFLVSSVIYKVETIEEMFEFSEKYSLNKMKEDLKAFIRYKIDQISSHKRFLSSGKPFVEFMSSINQYSQERKENVFKAVYEWTEHQVLKQENDEEENFDLVVAVKDELSVAFPHIYSMDKSAMNADFLIDFMIKKGLYLSPNDLKLMYERYGSRFEELPFKIVYRLAEKQALQRQKMASDGENFNLVDSIKTDLSEVIKIAKFYQMQKSFLMHSVVDKGIISAEQARHVGDTRICIENNGKTIIGVFEYDILHLKYIVFGTIRRRSKTIIRLLQNNFPIPSTPATVTKSDGIDWYLCLEEDGFLTFKHHSKIDEGDYLLAEMKSETEFSLDPNETTHVTACFNNLNSII